ncbi:MAG: TlpA family protein disulfide reductase [Chloroflexi bacterium]|nr:TlpA family protein disulfide reductase [Chloroflexota bacterium]
MRIPRRALFALAIVPLIALFALLIWAITRDSSNPTGFSTITNAGDAKVIQPIPADFTLPLYSGGSVRLSDLKGKVVMVDFWASWCDPCRQEAGEVEAAWQKYKDKGVVFIGIATRDKSADTQAFIQQFAPTYPIGADPAATIAVSYGVTGIPEKYFIGKDGRIAKKLAGPMTVARLSPVLDALLAAPAPVQ